jgi:ABC-type multidrug transport system permease subunit
MENMNKAIVYGYLLIWNLVVFGSTAYAVFVLDRSGWWFLLALMVMAQPTSAKE